MKWLSSVSKRLLDKGGPVCSAALLTRHDFFHFKNTHTKKKQQCEKHECVFIYLFFTLLSLGHIWKGICDYLQTSISTYFPVPRIEMKSVYSNRTHWRKLSRRFIVKHDSLEFPVKWLWKLDSWCSKSILLEILESKFYALDCIGVEKMEKNPQQQLENRKTCQNAFPCQFAETQEMRWTSRKKKKPWYVFFNTNWWFQQMLKLHQEKKQDH